MARREVRRALLDAAAHGLVVRPVGLEDEVPPRLQPAVHVAEEGHLHLILQEKSYRNALEFNENHAKTINFQRV